ncbi:cytochrome C assembly family protein [Neisseria animalis]|uniref:Inner membrane protein YpjD n=1 Tax=Neisseria animalis TaxID=492 RepID=A0A5P3MRE1_NEIAN|nr:cytochrome c biogenesis protein CcsA [Neisseria animalis]QEY24166.1 inner membrane protein YpjD [Neisseria animalis]ROW32227.1 inner membrane protein YpjD [Neisseria animalis]VEE06423.1 CcsA-like protein [Neisseria animalis]
MPIILICLIAVYAGLGVFVWLHQRKRGETHYPVRLEWAVLAPALLAHGTVLLLPVLRDQVLITGFGYSLSLIVWLMLMMYCLGSFFYNLRGLQLLLYPCAALSLLLGLLFPGRFIGYQVDDLPFMLHVGSSLLAYGLFGIVTLFAVLILLLNRNLHRRRLSPVVRFLPPLLSLEKMMFRGMAAGFVLLTYSVVSGTFFSESVFGKPLALTHKTVFGIASWLIYGGLLLKHSMMSWRGKKAAVWTIIGFISLILAYVGSKFVLEVVLNH